MAVLKFFKRGLLAVTLLGLSSVSAFALVLDIEVDKISQHMHVYVDGAEKYNWLVSTGGEGHDTPSGTYHVFRLDKDHFSKEWDDAPMPNSMFFSPWGHAIHGSYHIARLGTRASHGCVRLAPENAAILFDLVQKAGFHNSKVVIKGGFFDFSGNRVADASSSGPHKPLFWWLGNKPDHVVANNVKPVKAKVIKVILKKKKKKGLDLAPPVVVSSQG